MISNNSQVFFTKVQRLLLVLFSQKQIVQDFPVSFKYFNIFPEWKQIRSTCFLTKHTTSHLINSRFALIRLKGLKYLRKKTKIISPVIWKKNTWEISEERGVYSSLHAIGARAIAEAARMHSPTAWPINEKKKFPCTACDWLAAAILSIRKCDAYPLHMQSIVHNKKNYSRTNKIFHEKIVNK